MDRNDFTSVVEMIENAKGRMDDAQMNNASVYKEVEERFGVHRKAMKLFVALKRQDSARRNDFLRAFDLYRQLGELDAQPDMLDEDEDGDAETDLDETAEGENDAEVGEGGGDDSQEAEPLAASDDAETAPFAEETVAPVAEFQEGDGAGPSDAVLDQTGTIYAAGEQAARGDVERTANPYQPASGHNAKTWFKGFDAQRKRMLRAANANTEAGGAAAAVH